MYHSTVNCSNCFMLLFILLECSLTKNQKLKSLMLSYQDTKKLRLKRLNQYYTKNQEDRPQLVEEAYNELPAEQQIIALESGCRPIFLV